MKAQCADKHTWTMTFDGEPERGTLCDCGTKQWGVPLKMVHEHDWQFYANGTFCCRCGTQIGSGYACR